MMLEHKVRGILYSTWYHREASVPAALTETDAVLVDCFSDSADLPAVVQDERQGGRTTAELLLTAGHQRVAFIGTTTPSPAQSGRLAGYRDALAHAGAPFDESLVNRRVARPGVRLHRRRGLTDSYDCAPSSRIGGGGAALCSEDGPGQRMRSADAPPGR